MIIRCKNTILNGFSVDEILTAYKSVYSDEVNKITNLLQSEDKDLLMFIYFISYMFWRPLEIVRIKVSDVDLEKKTIKAETKTKASKTKIIPDLIFDDVRQFIKKKTVSFLNRKTRNGI